MYNPELLDRVVTILNGKRYVDISGENLFAHLENSSELIAAGLPSEPEVIEEIFDRLCEESDLASCELDSEGTSLERLFQAIYMTYLVQQKYRFVFFNLGSILGKNEKIKDRYYELVSLRKTQLLHLFQILEREGTLRGEILPGQYVNLANQMIMLSDYWLVQSCLIFEKDDRTQPHYYSKLVFSILVPYLSKQGLLKYESVLLKSTA